MSHLLAKVNTTLNAISAQARSLGTAAITWSNKLLNPYGRNPQRKSQIESLIVDFDKDNGINAVSAEALFVNFLLSLTTGADDLNLDRLNTRVGQTQMNLIMLLFVSRRTTVTSPSATSLSSLGPCKSDTYHCHVTCSNADLCIRATAVHFLLTMCFLISFFSEPMVVDTWRQSSRHCAQKARTLLGMKVAAGGD